MRDTGQITLGYSTHRLEALPFAAEWMRRHDVIVLEEPPDPGFEEMLQGRMDVDEYLGLSEHQFPLFGRGMCELLIEFRRQGKKLVQVEPYLAALHDIHEFFDGGGRPHDIGRGSLWHRVHDTEREWTGSLLAYYEKSARGPFDAVVQAVKDFATVDAARGRIRDELRAKALTALAGTGGSIYVETGATHFYLARELRRRLPPGGRLRRVYLMEPWVRRLCGKRRILGPGDLLTMIYTYRPGYDGRWVDLLAARSLIHVMLLFKEEQPAGGDDPAPHTRNEIECGRIVERLSYRDCRELYGRLRGRSGEESRAIAAEWSPCPAPSGPDGSV